MLVSFPPFISTIPQVSQARVCSMQGRVEALSQSEVLLTEHVSALEEEKKQLVSTVQLLQDILTSLGMHSTPDGQTLPPPSERDTVTATEKVEEREGGANRTVDSPPHPLVLPEGS